MNLRIHPVAELYPRLPEAELLEMADSISREGLNYACVRQGDVLLDGRNRLEACKMAGVEPTFSEYKGDSPVGFIIASNLKRRHLSKDQKIALALEIEPYFAKEAKKRQLATLKKGSASDVENVPQREQARSRDRAAAAVGLSGKLVSAAKAIRAADPELFEKVRAGELSVTRAVREIKERNREERRRQNQATVSQAKAASDLEGKFSTIVMSSPRWRGFTFFPSSDIVNEVAVPSRSDVKKIRYGSVESGDDCD